MTWPRAAACAITLLGCAAAHAQQPQGAAGMAGRSAGLLLVQALLSLAVVVGVIYLAYFGLRRISARSLGISGRLGAGAEGPLRVIQARHLGGDRWLYLIEIGRRRLVVGGATGQVTPIADLGDTQDEAADDDPR